MFASSCSTIAVSDLESCSSSTLSTSESFDSICFSLSISAVLSPFCVAFFVSFVTALVL